MSETAVRPGLPARGAGPASRWLLAVLLLVLIATSAIVGPPLVRALRFVEVWERAATVVSVSNQSFTDERGTRGPITGWRQVNRFSGERTGLERWWYDENGAIARETSLDGKTNYFEPSGALFLQSATDSTVVPGIPMQSFSIEFRVQAPWLHDFTEEAAPSAPWLGAELSPAQWWEQVRPK